MDCPNDGATLLMSERLGVEIDYCPTCRGVWLDRGELDKLIERGKAELNDDAKPDRSDRPERRPPPPPPPPPRDYDDDRYRYERYDRYDPRYRKKKKRSFLEDIFDFD
ncbi:MAG TPA: zf-TFIIB domain-containing protein [Acidimicrobiales bacterium]|jgi:uncharacterized protein|nr:zf-TFIIB domain-containing protein [Acidimicrobiales bacterium]